MKVDNPFKSKLYQHTLPVRDDLWTAIEKQLPPEEKERVFPFFWLILFASTLLSGALMFGILNRSKTPPPDAVKPPAYTLSTPSTSISSTPGTTSTPSDLNANTIPSDITSTSVSTLSEHPSFPSPQTLKHPLSSSYHKTLRQKEVASFAQATSAASSFTSSPASAPASFSASAAAWTTTELPSFGFKNLRAATRHKPMMKKIKPDPSCYKFSGVTGRYELSVDAFAGPGFSPRSFSESGPESSIYMQARKSTESNQYAWAAGARLNLLLHNGVAFRLGLMYDQAGDVFDYTDTLATQSTTRVDSFFAADGTFLYADTNRVLIFGTLIQKIHNTYRHLDIPLLISYEMPLGHSTLMLNAGPVFNLSTSYEGEILDPMLHPRSITPGNPQQLSAYKTSLGISLYLGLGALFPLSDHWSALVEPRYLYRIKPVTIKSYPLEEHRHFAALNLGLRYHFD